MIEVIFVFLILMILGGVAIILITKNIVHAAYALCLTLVGVAGLYVLLMSELLAVVQIMLYAGGVIILLAFGVMMTNRLRGEKVLSESKNQILGGMIALGTLSGLMYLISSTSFDNSSELVKSDQVRQLGISFLTDHIIAFELIAFILLVALVGAAYLAKMSANE
ncbi:NADH-quinone oxidoreductase subunit J [Ekhidna sp.]|uniref:NADH-quinone oxidoreductase subunit J family protein n=1 Tax=Ekhidna sp. TaxID=2608089 RepID=UPI0032978575